MPSLKGPTYLAERLEINGETYARPLNFKKQERLPVGVAFHEFGGKRKSWSDLAPAGTNV